MHVSHRKQGELASHQPGPFGAGPRLACDHSLPTPFTQCFRTCTFSQSSETIQLTPSQVQTRRFPQRGFRVRELLLEHSPSPPTKAGKSPLLSELPTCPWFAFSSPSVPTETKPIVAGGGDEVERRKAQDSGQHIPESLAPDPAALVQFIHPFSPKRVQRESTSNPGSATHFTNLYNGVNKSPTSYIYFKIQKNLSHVFSMVPGT